MKNLAGKVAIISGGLGDIGKAIARELASRGANIALGDLADRVTDINFLTDLHQTGVHVRYAKVDISHADTVKHWVAQVEAELGAPDLIIPNAAIVALETLSEITPESWRHQLSINLDGAFYLAQFASQRLVALNKPGRIVFLGSWVADRPRSHIPTYCVSKAALRMLMRSMALALAPHNILVNEVAPGNVDAGLSAQVFREKPELREPNTRMIPLGRLITAEEVAYQVAHLCDPRSNHNTGSVLLMDGGLSQLSDARHE
jgi:glucose 1-dehydrogenase